MFENNFEYRQEELGFPENLVSERVGLFCSPVGRNKPVRATARISVSGKHPQIAGNAASRYASFDIAQESPFDTLRAGLDALIPVYAYQELMRLAMPLDENTKQR